MTRHRTEASVMVRGMGLGMKVLELLVQKLKEHKGNPEVLAFLTRPRFEDNLDRIVQAMVACDWRIPASEMRHLAEGYYRREFEVDIDLLEEVRNFWWFSPLEDMGIPYERFSSNPEGDEEPPIPKDIKKELEGKKMEYPLLLRQGSFTVVDWAYDGDCKPGQLIEARKVQYLKLAEARHFDFDN